MPESSHHTARRRRVRRFVRGAVRNRDRSDSVLLAGRGRARLPVADGGNTKIRVAAELMPFAGISFLWFIGTVRAGMGELEDRFFATVTFGSGLLFWP